MKRNKSLAGNNLNRSLGNYAELRERKSQKATYCETPLN
jgi:hypothetical protein